MNLGDLLFAQRYPFSGIARNIVNETGLNLQDVSEAVTERAQKMILAAAKQQKYDPQIGNYEELLQNEVLAFPVAKILLSIIAKPELYAKFAGMFSKSSFVSLQKENDETLQDIAKDLGIKIKFSGNAEEFAEIGMLQYLGADFREDFMKLINQRLEKGKIILSKNEFVRFLSQAIYRKIFTSLPTDTKGIPDSFRAIANALSKQAFSESFQAFNAKLSGNIKADAFPPCISEMYAKILSGANLNHTERFTLAAFLVSVGMGVEQVIAVFKNAPNFNEKITRYQIERIAGSGNKTNYAPASCAKMKSYKLCIRNGELCGNIKHPMQFYRSRAFPRRKPR